jgi:putative heme iron utilization protein
MNPEQNEALRRLVDSQQVASLGTLHDGAPYVSMVPFAVLPNGTGLAVHVSGLAAHTKDMLESPAVSLMIVGAREEGVPAQALPRVTIQGRAAAIDEESADYAPAKEAYLARFPDSARMFELADFVLFRIAPVTARYVGGFAQAFTLAPDSLARALTA